MLLATAYYNLLVTAIAARTVVTEKFYRRAQPAWGHSF